VRYGRKCGSNWGCYCFLFEKKTNILCNITYSPSHRQASTPMINIQSTLRTAPDVCKNVSLAVIIQIIHIQSVRSLICAYIYIYTHIYIRVWYDWSTGYICFWWGLSYMIDLSYSFYDLFALLFEVSYLVCGIYIYMRVCVYIYTHIYTHTYTHTYMHTYMHTYTFFTI
jgi:hypothetical protein